LTIEAPAGSGPEFVVKGWAEGSIYQRERPLTIGDAGVVEETTRLLSGMRAKAPSR
jgi:hypothetical protein